MSINFSCHTSFVTCVALLIGFVGTVQAATDTSLVLEEIVVTATKRTESLQDVPISIAVVSGETIEKFAITDVRDLQSFVPNLAVQRTFGNWAVRVRGLGSGVTNLAFDSSVSIFNDGVYCGRSRCLETAFLDVGRVEVARGPQGALFGKSTIAGAVSVLAARPTAELEGYVRGGYEMEDGGYTVAAMLSGPLSDTLRGRLAAEVKDLDGWMDNPLGKDDEPQTEHYAVRGSFEWDVNDNVLAYLKIEKSDTELDGRANQLVSSGLFGAITSDSSAEFERDTTRRVSTGTSEEDYDYSDSFGVTLQVDMGVGEHTLTAIANHWELDYENYLDVDGVSDLFLNTSLSEEYEQQSFEIRLLSPLGQTFEYIVGGLYHTSETQTRQYSPFGFFPAVGVPAFLVPDPVGMDRNFERDTDTFSVYGQVTLNVSDRVRVIADLRYTDEEQDGVGRAFPVVFPDNRTPVYEPTAFAQPAEYLFRQKRTDDSIDPSLRVQYDVNDNVTVYAGYSTGSKPGGLKANDGVLGDELLAVGDSAFYQRFVGQPTVTPADMIAGLTLAEGNAIFDFEDEEAENFEVGAKMVFAEGRANVNVAVFSMQFDNLQTSSYNGTRIVIQNAASADIKGFEVEGTWQATSNLRLSGAWAYLDHEFDEFFGAQCIVIDEAGSFEDPTCTDGFEDLSGERLERTPDWELNLSANWQSQLTDSTLLLATVAMYHSDEYSVRQDFHPLGVQDSYTKWDARVAVVDASDRWEVALMGRNLSDERVIQHAYEIAGSNFVTESRGRAITLEATYRM